jgi:hypothetical protein
MKTSQVFRIALALAIIFVAGILTGRWTTPRAPTQLATAGGKLVSSEVITSRLTAELGLDPGQRIKVATIIDEAAEQMATLPPATAARREIFRKCVPRIRAVLRPDQHSSLDRYVELSERHWARIIRRRDMKQGTGNSDLPPPATTSTNDRPPQ